MNTLKTSLEYSHVPVMLKEVAELFYKVKNGNFLDCTFGGGGFSKKILEIPHSTVTAIDRDNFVVQFADKIKRKYPDRFYFHHEKFSNLDKITKDQRFDIVIFDLGISSFQIEDFSRGFSFKSKEKLDMCMGLSSLSAEYIINNYDEKNLKLILKILGEENEASKIVKNIIKERNIKKITKVHELVGVIEKSKKKNYKKKINLSTKTFQALRIFVNKETTELIEGIIKATKILKPGGKLIVISFHSIEDKIIKYFFKNFSTNKSRQSRYIPEESNRELSLFYDYKNKAFTPSREEIEKNPRSKSAKLRFATRNENKFYSPDELRLKFKRYINLEALNA